MALAELPHDVLYRLFEWLDDTSLARLMRTSRRMAAFANDESLWRRRCRARFPDRLTRIEEWRDIASYHDLFVILECTYYLDGIWSSVNSPRGSVIHVYVWPDVIYTCQLLGQPELDRDERRAVGIYYRQQPQTSVTFSELRQRLCRATGVSSTGAAPGSPEVAATIEVRRVSNDCFTYLFDDTLRSFSHTYSRIPRLAAYPVGDSLQGLWRGEYGPHGREIIEVLPPDEAYLFRGLKRTGDRNVPAGQLTFRVPHQSPAIEVTPAGTIVRYQGEGQVAETGHVNSEFVAGDLWHIRNDYTLFFFRWQRAFTIQFGRLEVFEHTRPALVGPPVPDLT